MGTRCSIVISMPEARVFLVVAPGRREIRKRQLRSLAPGELLIRALVSAISRGSESLVFRGEVAGERISADALPVPRRRVPRARQIRLCHALRYD